MNIAGTHLVEQSAPASNGELLRQCNSEQLGRLGSLTVRLARSPQEVRATQELRHRIFFSARSNAPGAVPIEEDRYDEHCDHLLVEDGAASCGSGAQFVGTYRLLTPEAAKRSGGYCSQSEYDVASLANRHPERRFLELGRSCVLPEYRSKRTAELLWHGIWAYCRIHAIDVMFGCASFEGTRPALHALPLSFLWHHARVGGCWTVDPTSRNASTMDLVPAEAIHPARALAVMPPLVKGYLRLGAKFSGSAVVDPHFGTTDVLVVLRTEDIADRYLNHYGPEGGRFS